MLAHRRLYAENIEENPEHRNLGLQSHEPLCGERKKEKEKERERERQRNRRKEGGREGRKQKA